MNIGYLKIAGVALAAYAVIALVQSKMPIPIVGMYLPK
jgi:hypothetical protein